MGLVLAGHAALATGHVGHALVPLREAWAGFADSAHEFRFRCRTLLATSYAIAGRPEAARPLVDALVGDRHPAYVLYAPEDELARAWLAAAEGSLGEAVGLAEAAAALARRQSSPAYEVLAWQTATQLGGAGGAVERLAALADEVAGPRVGVALTHARALAALDADGLAASAHAWEGLGDLVAAGDAAAQAADVHRRYGRTGSALTAAARAQEIAHRSGAWTPALATAARPLPLTPREREIALLAARGMSNREIAARLTVSVRTVEGHLYRAGHKLDVSDRAELAGILSGSPAHE
ncbi:helix-turn-helix transcriptional regulator [Cellulomonas fimi]|uniref:Helix-turn-helix transcriptional regulator n=2 Tax=Cellulomonas fimi TaxID=1708 RepID=A0A7Y0LY53_CELFI|nr:helix-turn-helix transcriptional regulator [Cellulomonas fimi]